MLRRGDLREYKYPKIQVGQPPIKRGGERDPLSVIDEAFPLRVGTLLGGPVEGI